MDPYPDPVTHIWIRILFLALILLLCALLKAANTALDECSRSKIKAMSNEGNQEAAKLLRILDNEQSFISCSTTLIVFSVILSSAFAAFSFAPKLADNIAAGDFSYIAALCIISVITAFCVLVLAIIFPARIAALHPESVALMLAGRFNALLVIAKPFALINNTAVTILLKMTRQTTKVDDEEFSEDEVMDMLEVGQESGALKEEGKKMINSIFEFDDKLAYEIMTPRTDVFMIDINDPAEEYLDELMELRYSRIPVYEDDSDNIIGVMYIKDYFAKAYESGFDNVDIKSILRKPYFVPETKNIDSLFVQLQSTKNQIAILIDEFGGFSGIVSMEDIIEEVMGDIEDEYDENEMEIEQVSSDTWLVSGSTDIDDINEQTGLNLDSDTSETIGGLVLDILGEIPEDGENLDQSLMLSGCTIVVKKVAERRIERVLLIKAEPKDERTDDESKN